MFSQMMFYVQEFLRWSPLAEEEGQGLVEYALILVLIAVGVLVVVGTLGGQVEDIFQAIVDSFTTALQ